MKGISDVMQNKIDFVNTPVVDVVNGIIIAAAKAGASDIHFDHQEHSLKVRIRIDGILNDYADIPNEVKNNILLSLLYLYSLSEIM